MSIKVQSEFIRKATVRILCYVYDDNEDLVEATSVKVTVIDPTGATKVDDLAMSPSATGVYEYYFLTLVTHEEGNWQIQCDIADSTYHTFVNGHFRLKAGI